MKPLIIFSKTFNSLNVKFYNYEIEKIKQIDNITYLFNKEDSLVGFNVFNPDLQTLDKNSILSDDYQSRDFVNKIFKDYTKSKLDFDDQFLVVEIKELEKIPNTHLSLCKVDNGSEEIQIVCGASNVKKGMKTVLATVGSWVPSIGKLDVSELKGNKSFGMLCSASELLISDGLLNKIGIIELNDSFNVGESFFRVINNEKN